MDSFDNAVEAGTIVFFDTARDNDAAPICSYVASNGRACRSAATGPQYCVSHTCRTPDCLRPKRSREPICLECKDLNNSCLAELNGEEMYPPAPAEQPRRPTEFGIKSFDPAVSPRACTTTVHVTVEEDLYSGFPDVADAAPETGKPVNPEASAPKPPAAYVNIFVRRYTNRNAYLVGPFVLLCRPTSAPTTIRSSPGARSLVVLLACAAAVRFARSLTQCRGCTPSPPAD